MLIGFQIIVLYRLPVKRLAALHDAGMYTRIQNHLVVFGQDRPKRITVRSVTRGVDDRVFLSEKSRDLLFQQSMIIIMPADSRGCTRTRALLLNTRNRGLFYSRMLGEA